MPEDNHDKVIHPALDPRLYSEIQEDFSRKFNSEQ
jgi:hypothetical protein